MRVLVDSSVWSLAFRKRGPTDHPAVVRLSALLQANHRLCVTGLILQEVLQAFRAERSFQTMAEHLESFELVDLRRADFIQAAALHRRCAARGVAASTADCQIAMAAIRHGCLLLTADKDFTRIARLSELELLEYPGR